MKRLYGSMLNVLLLMLDRTMVIALAIAGCGAVLYLFMDVPMGRNISQMLILIMIPMLSVWSARSSYGSRWSMYERSWSGAPLDDDYCALHVVCFAYTGGFCGVVCVPVI
ncbi:MAG: hypothetical protein FWC16_04530 [Defluviitaleaceae bacterium]|nr:hypothetical protein [Defluviitaleaceae bacterium]MCL2274174.1 hypothetical protein [Defluviitaleaceae bacterium]